MNRLLAYRFNRPERLRSVLRSHPDALPVTSSGGSGFGTVFKFTAAGAFTLLTSFTGTSGSAKGAVPQQLLLHTDGNFYGTTQAGGAAGWGTVFRLTPAGAVTTLVLFLTRPEKKTAEPPKDSIAFAPWATPRSGGAMLVGSF